MFGVAAQPELEYIDLIESRPAKRGYILYNMTYISTGGKYYAKLSSGTDSPNENSEYAHSTGICPTLSAGANRLVLVHQFVVAY